MLADSFKTSLESELNFRLLSNDRVSSIEIECDTLARSAKSDVQIEIILKTLLPSLQELWVGKVFGFFKKSLVDQIIESVDTILTSQSVVEIVVTESLLAAQDSALFTSPSEGTAFRLGGRKSES